MKRRELYFHVDALEELKDWIKSNPRIAKKIIELCEACLQDPSSGIGKPEALKHNRQGYWSRRITKEHRLVYKADETSIRIVSCKYHYS